MSDFFSVSESLSLLGDDGETVEQTPDTTAYTPPRSGRQTQTDLALNADPLDPDLVRTVRRQRPGVPPRAQNILSQTDSTQLAAWYADDPVRAASFQAASERLASRHVAGFAGWQADLARLDAAVQSGAASDAVSKRLNKLSSNPSEEDLEGMEALADVLDQFNDDLSIGKHSRLKQLREDGSVVVSHPVRPNPQDLSFQELVESADGRVAKLLTMSMSVAPVEDFTEDELISAVLGAPIEGAGKKARFAVNDLLDRFGEPDEVGKVLVAAYRKLRSEFDVALPEGDDSPNVLQGVLGGVLHDAADYRPTGVLADDLDGHSDGIESTRRPDGSTSIAAPVNPDTARILNGLYPAVQGADGTPRWLPIRPDRTVDLRRVKNLAGATTANVESWLESDLARAGGHPLTTPGDKIVFTLDGHVPQLLGPSQQIGQVVREGTARKMTEPDWDGLTEEQFLQGKNSPLRTHQWAIYVSDDGAAELRFGEDANAVIDEGTWTQRTMITPEGVLDSIDPDLPPEITIDTPIGTVSVPWRQFVDESGDPLQTPRAATTARKLMLKPDPSRIAEIAEALEQLGAQDVSIYTTQSDVPGFSRVSEHLATDGVETISYRTAQQDSNDPGAGFVWVRGTDGLSPEKVATPPRLYAAEWDSPLVAKNDSETFRTFVYAGAGLTPVNGNPEAVPGAVLVHNSGQRAVVKTADNDLTQAVEVAHQVRALGYQKPIVIQSPAGEHKLAG